MPRTLLVLACHGSQNDPAVNEGLRRHANDLRQLGLFDDVVAAFKQGDPKFHSVVDEHPSDVVAVLPVTTSEGDFTTNYLPRELAKNRRYDRSDIKILPPLGVHPMIGSIAIDRVEHLCRHHGLNGPQIALVGHGTRRHVNSTESTEQLARQLGYPGLPAITGYLDDTPAIETIVERSAADTILVIPFFIAAGPHATADIPTRLGLTLTGQMPVDQRVGDHRLIVDRPLGEDTSIGRLLATMVIDAYDRLVKRAAIVQHGGHD